MLKPRHTDDSKVEVGIDEAGRGSLWGPLCAAAVVWPREADWTDEIRALSTQVRDSKKVTPKRRAALEGQIKEVAVAWAVGRVEPAEIDQFGMTKSNRLAFQRALDGLEMSEPAGRIIIDGILTLGTPGTEEIVVPKADGTYLAVAAASILAKEAHDRIIRDATEETPTLESTYSILRSKGYGTAAHRAAIKEHGPLPGHRRLFLRTLLGIEHQTEASAAAGAGSAYTFLEEP
jgi:ribonuclease HII